MPPNHQFQHLPLLMRYQGTALIHGGGKTSAATSWRRSDPANHEDLRAAVEESEANVSGRLERKGFSP